MKYYLRIEGVNLDNFVYDTQDVSTIRGSGLAILEAVNLLADKEIKFDGDKIILGKISAGASTGLFHFESPKEEKELITLCSAVEDLLRNYEHTYEKGNQEITVFPFRFATFTIDILKFTDDLDLNFTTDREKILAKNRWRQLQSPSFVIPAYSEDKVDGFKRVSCEVDGVRRAIREEPFKGKLKEISEPVYHRRGYGFDKKQKFFREELKGFKEVKIERNFAWDFDDLTFGSRDRNVPNKDKGNLHHKMALIYLDGNSFGARQRDLDSRTLGEFDDKLKDFHRGWLADLMGEVTKSPQDWLMTNDDGELLYQLEVLLWGGDEVCLVLPAWKGLSFVDKFFQHKFEFAGETLTHSLGLVFCHHNAPVRRIRDLAESLTKLAKSKSRKKNQFAYEILESFDHIGKDLKVHRESRCPQIQPIDIEKTILDGDAVKGMLKGLRELKTFFPRRKLIEIVTHLLSKDVIPKKRVERKGQVDNLVRTSIGKENHEKINNLAKLFGNDKYVALINAHELWDYVEEANL